MIHPSIYDIAQLLHLKGIEYVVLSPGSRNAPLILSFVRHPGLKVISIVDERSAGFIALGIAQKTRKPVVICCTSGTALLNYAPAVAEAFYQKVPLIIMSADRPPEWIDQRDGQTINQSHALGHFVKAFYQLPVSPDHPDEKWEFNRKLNEAVNQSGIIPQGPVHINIPFREPFYPEGEQLTYSKNIRIIEVADAEKEPHIPKDWLETWGQYSKRLIVVGQHPIDEILENLLKKVSKEAAVPVITDVISNQSSDVHIQYHDLFLAQGNEELLATLRPDLVISTGQSVISKSLKSFLRKYPPKAHWHFDPCLNHADTYQSITRIVGHDLKGFLKSIEGTKKKKDFHEQVQSNYQQNWSIQNQKTQRKLNEALDQSAFSEFTATRYILEKIPPRADLHLANSMPVRYANFIHGIDTTVHIRANRGTSGIDGTNGTAVGNAIAAKNEVILLTGDLSFFYDRNAFFHHHDLSNLKIIVINNYGGGIFRLISGPASLPELETYFETRHNHSAKFAAAEFGFDYFAAKDQKSLHKGLEALFRDNKEKKLLEVFTDPKQNQEVYQKIKNSIHE